jgi:membrane protein
VTRNKRASTERLTINSFLHELMHMFRRNQTLDLAAQVAYFGLLAVFPFAMFVLTLMGFIPVRGLHQEIIVGLQSVLPPEVAGLIEATLNEIIGKEHGWLLVSALGFAIWTASGAVTVLITAFNRAYEVAETRPHWRVKVRALVVTLAGAVAAIVATAAMLVGPDLVRQAWSFFGFGGAFDRLWAWLRWPTAALVMTSMVAFTYYFLPNIQKKRRSILPGAIVAVLTWLAVSLAFRWCVARFSAYARFYGALSTVVLLLVWLYLWGITLIVGGEINAIVERRLAQAHKETPPEKEHRAALLVLPPPAKS